MKQTDELSGAFRLKQARRSRLVAGRQRYSHFLGDSAGQQNGVVNARLSLALRPQSKKPKSIKQINEMAIAEIIASARGQ
jgi:hypothetical protein